MWLTDYDLSPLFYLFSICSIFFHFVFLRLLYAMGSHCWPLLDEWWDSVFILGEYSWFILGDTLWLRGEWNHKGRLRRYCSISVRRMERCIWVMTVDTEKALCDQVYVKCRRCQFCWWLRWTERMQERDIWTILPRILSIWVDKCGISSKEGWKITVSRKDRQYLALRYLVWNSIRHLV